jgi:hypothetical protein
MENRREDLKSEQVDFDEKWSDRNRMKIAAKILYKRIKELPHDDELSRVLHLLIESPEHLERNSEIFPEINETE